MSSNLFHVLYQCEEMLRWICVYHVCFWCWSQARIGIYLARISRALARNPIADETPSSLALKPPHLRYWVPWRPGPRALQTSLTRTTWPWAWTLGLDRRPAREKVEDDRGQVVTDSEEEGVEEEERTRGKEKGPAREPSSSSCPLRWQWFFDVGWFPL